MRRKSFAMLGQSPKESSVYCSALRDECGGVSLLVLCISLGLISVLCTCAGFAQVAAQIRKTETAADLSALAGASHLVDTHDQICDRVRMVAELNASDLERCEVKADSVAVVVGQPTETLILQRFLPVIRATAKAGY